MMKSGNKDQIQYLIIGAGPTGLGAAYRLKDLGHDDFLVLERSPHAGGLSSSFKDEQGFLWDIGGHVQFSHYEYFDRVMQEALGAEGWLHHQRESWAWMRERFVPYPVQNNIRYFPKEIMWKCLEGLIACLEKPNHKLPENFYQWMVATFGEGLTQEFMLPYNFKVWAYKPEEMAFQWVGERVAVTDVKRVTKNVLFEKDDLSWGPNNTFQFPKDGGTGAIWNGVADQVGRDKIELGAEVVTIDSDRKTVTLTSGRKIRYEYLISTLPIDQLCQLVIPVLPKEVVDASKGLKFSSSNIVGIGLKGKPSEALRTKCWLYFPEDNCPFYRATVFSNYSPTHVPDISRYWSLMTETSESPRKPVDKSRILEDTIQGCLNASLIKSRDEIASTWVYRAHYGYPTPSLERDACLNVIHPYLDSIGVYSRGRFGAWKYEVSNQDHSFMQGVEWVNKVCLGVPETTVFYPNVANANWGKRSPQVVIKKTKKAA
jgi:protoporphyrinogen oxidase